MDINLALEFLRRDSDIEVVPKEEEEYEVEGNLFSADEIIDEAEVSLDFAAEFEGVTPAVYLAGFQGTPYLSCSLLMDMLDDRKIQFGAGDIDCIEVFGRSMLKKDFMVLGKEIMTLLAVAEGTTLEKLIAEYWKKSH